MKFDDIFDVAGGIVLVAMAATIVSRRGNTANVISALGRAFSDSLKAAKA